MEKSKINYKNLTFDYVDLRRSAIEVYCNKHEIDLIKAKSKIILKYLEEDLNSDLYNLIYDDIDSLKDIDILFESVFSKEDKESNGIVFTPEYIVNYIIENTIEEVDYHTKVLDPACGCGSFLIPAIEYIHNKFGLPISTIIEKNIYGFDINEHNIENIQIIIRLLAMKYGEFSDIKDNLFAVDSLSPDLFDLVGMHDTSFDYIIGNPPYVNNHSMSTEYVRFLRENYSTTTKGVFNIFYAFIERYTRMLNSNGKLTYIIPNNWFVISSAEPLRSFFLETKVIRKLVDFTSNLIFNPVKTYNSIVFLDNTKKDKLDFGKLSFSNNIEVELNKVEFNSIEYNHLNNKSWNLVTNKEREIISQIESYDDKLGNYIRTGIATLSDKLYMVDKNNEFDDNYYLITENKIDYKIEKKLVKKLIKISKNANEEAIRNSTQGIIFPYKKVGDTFIVISEEEMMITYPKAYEYFFAVKEVLAKRTSDNPNAKEWYKYGRSQGINNYGMKLVFPTFSKKPRFVLDVEEDSLFCNGYAVFIDRQSHFSNFPIALKNLLNSSIMEYYISKTSYSIEGDFKCYQKKYVANFGIPELSIEEIEKLSILRSQKEINDFVTNLYGISLPE